MEKNIAKRTYKKRKIWSVAEEQKLIEVWRDFLPALRSNKRNNKIYEEMAAALNELGLVVDKKEIQNKVSNLSQKYREEKRIVGSSGCAPLEWFHYEAIHEFVGKSKCNDATIVEESYVYSEEQQNSDDRLFESYECETPSPLRIPIPLLTPVPSAAIAQTPGPLVTPASAAAAIVAPPPLVTPVSGAAATKTPTRFMSPVSAAVATEEPGPSRKRTSSTPAQSSQTILIPPRPSSAPSNIVGRQRSSTEKRKRVHDHDLLEELQKSNNLLQKEIDTREKAEKEAFDIERQKIKLMEQHIELQLAFLKEFRNFNNNK